MLCSSTANGVKGSSRICKLRLRTRYRNLISRSITFIIRTLPSQLASNPATPITANTTLINTYAALPYILLKRCIESPAFKFGSDQERFQFAKKVVAVRKQSVGPAIEESVVLAFKGDAGSAVHITRKPKRKAALWKVEK